MVNLCWYIDLMYTDMAVDETHVMIRKDYMEEVSELLQTEVSSQPFPYALWLILSAREEHLYPGSRYVMRPRIQHIITHLYVN
jgi:hypothetical protein